MQHILHSFLSLSLSFAFTTCCCVLEFIRLHWQCGFYLFFSTDVDADAVVAICEIGNTSGLLVLCRFFFQSLKWLMNIDVCVCLE